MTEQQKVFLKDTTAIQRINKVLDSVTPSARSRVLGFVVDAENNREAEKLRSDLQDPYHKMAAPQGRPV